MSPRRTAARAALATAIGGAAWIAIGVALLAVPHLWDWWAERNDKRIQRYYDQNGYTRGL